MLGECDDVTEGSRGPEQAESDGGIPLSEFTRQAILKKTSVSGVAAGWLKKV